PPQIGHGIATVTLIPGDDCKSPLVPPGNIQTQNAADGSFTLTNVPDGNYGIRGLASGYLTACRLIDVSGGVLQGTLPNATLRAGDTNFPGDNSGSYGQVDVTDVSLIAAAFGETPPNRVDSQGRYVDLNGDGIVDILDVSAAASSFGL